MILNSEVNKLFLGLRAINYFDAYIQYGMTPKFQLEVSENKVIFFPPSQFTELLKSKGFRGPQDKNGCSKRRCVVTVTLHLTCLR